MAVKWAVPETGSDAARALLAEPVLAPDLLRAELAQALFKKVRRGELSAAEALLAQIEVETLLSFLPSTELSGRALELSLELDHAAGDCFFLAVAEITGIPIVTADTKFVVSCAGTAYEHLVSPLA